MGEETKFIFKIIITSFYQKRKKIFLILPLPIKKFKYNYDDREKFLDKGMNILCIS